MNHAVAEILKLIVWFSMFIIMVAVFGYFVQLNESQDLKPYVAQQIQRNGGLTQTAQSNIDEYVKDNYNSLFKVKSLSGSDKKPFGTQIEYEISGNVKVAFINVPGISVHITGTAYTLVK